MQPGQQPNTPPLPGAMPPPPAGAPTKYCFACGQVIDYRAEICPKCGVRQQMAAAPSLDQQLAHSRLVAALLGIFLGTFGVHKFYLGRIGEGVIYLVFFWTFIPAIVGFIEGIWYLTMSDAEFWARFPPKH